MTFGKRKKGLLKKSMELSILCDVEVLLYIYDKNEKLNIFKSNEETPIIIQKYFNDESRCKEYYTNSNVIIIFIQFIV